MSGRLLDPVTDVRFVLDEMVRHQEMLNSGEYQPREDWFCTVPNPTGFGSLPIGRAAYDRIADLAREAARRGNITRRADGGTLRTECTDGLIRMFIKDGVKLSKKSVARFLRETHEAVSAAFKTQVHVLPCHLSTKGDDTELVLGPVKFVGRGAARRILAPGVLSYRRRDVGEYRRDREVIAQGMKFYAGYRWFAAVTITHSDRRRSEELARRAATSALDFVQLLIGARYSRRMAILGPASHFERLFSLGIAHGQLKYTVTTSYLGEVSLPDDWVRMIQKDYSFALEQIGIILESVAQADLERPLSRRLLDAAQWFGEAVRDPSPSTRLIKFVLAIERLVLTGEAFGLTELVAKRVATLCIGVDGRDAETLKVDFRAVYDMRSKLAHGDISPNDEKVPTMLGLAADFAQCALLRCLHQWTKEEFELTHLSRARVKAWFDRAVGKVFPADGK